MHFKLKIVFVILFIAIKGFGQDITIKLNDDYHNSFKIAYELYVLVDTNASIQFENAQESAQFRLHQQSIAPNLGIYFK
jgi:hypothetical protein